MKKVFKDTILSEAEAILKQLEDIDVTAYTGVNTLKAVIPLYNKWINHITDNPRPNPIQPLNNSDISTDGYCNELSENGVKKLTEIRKTCYAYKESHTPIPPTEVKGWSKANVIGAIAIIIAISIYAANQAYQIGVSNGKSETQRGFDAEKISLSQKIDSLKAKYNIINDSLKACNVNVIVKNDSLKECNASIIAKKDSISPLVSKNKQANNNKKGSAK